MTALRSKTDRVPRTKGVIHGEEEAVAEEDHAQSPQGQLIATQMKKNRTPKCERPRYAPQSVAYGMKAFTMTSQAIAVRVCL